MKNNRLSKFNLQNKKNNYFNEKFENFNIKNFNNKKRNFTLFKNNKNGTILKILIEIGINFLINEMNGKKF